MDKELEHSINRTAELGLQQIRMLLMESFAVQARQSGEINDEQYGKFREVADEHWGKWSDRVAQHSRHLTE